VRAHAHAALSTLAALFISVACQTPVPATTCVVVDDCPPGYRCAEEGFCVSADGGSGADGGSMDDGSVREDAGPTLPVEIVNLSATPSTIEWGSAVQISWETRHASTCRLDGVELATTGTVDRRPLASRWFVLSCQNAIGAARAQTEVTVQCSSPQTVDLGDVTEIVSQAELDALVADVNGCFELVGDLQIHDSVDIFELSALGGLTRVDGDLDLWGNQALASLDGLESLALVTDDLRVGRFISALDTDVGNPALRTVRGLSGLRLVGGDLELQDTPIESLAGLEQLREVGGQLVIEELLPVPDLRPLARLERVGSRLELDDLPVVSSLTGLEALVSVDKLFIDDMVNLVDLTALSNLGAVRSIALVNNNQLADLSGLEQIRGVSGDVEIRECDALVSIAPLAQAFEPTLERLQIVGNDRLSSLDAFAGLQAVVADADATCEVAAALNNTCMGSLRVVNNGDLASLAGLGGLTQIDADLAVMDNPSLASLAPLSSVVTLGGDLRVEANATLGDVALNPACSFAGPDLTVKDNPSLAQASAQELADAWTGAGPPGSFNVTVENNGTALP
jgi:hypothetical protein